MLLNGEMWNNFAKSNSKPPFPLGRQSVRRRAFLPWGIRDLRYDGVMQSGRIEEQ